MKTTLFLLPSIEKAVNRIKFEVLDYDLDTSGKCFISFCFGEDADGNETHTLKLKDMEVSQHLLNTGLINDYNIDKKTEKTFVYVDNIHSQELNADDTEIIFELFWQNIDKTHFAELIIRYQIKKAFQPFNNKLI